MVYKMFYLNLALILWTSLLTYSGSSGQSCDSTWFGSSTCLYKCRCTSTCDPTTGACQAGGRCQGGWFGPTCQYADLAYNLPPTNLTDGDDTTCLPPGSGDTVTLNLTRNYPFTWLRLHVSGSGKEFLESFKIQFRGSQNLTCQDLQQSKIDETTLDVHCRVSESVQFVTVTGEVVKFLCSIYISKGRNVALHQYASQSTIYFEKSNLTSKNISFDATKAVDGNTSQIFYDQSCTHTGNQSADMTNAEWHVVFDRSFDVAMFSLYNRNEYMIRLQNFILESFDAQNNLVFRYTESGSPPQLVYNLILNGIIPVKSTNIRLSYGMLTLCEVEIYGDTHCSPGHYGRECENTCNCNNGGSCFVSTGGCPLGCAADYMGVDCQQACSDRTYGLRCQQRCSTFCEDSDENSSSVCYHKTGACLYGCKPGYQGLTCSSPTPTSGPSSDVIIPAVIVPVVFVFIIVCFIVLIFRRKRLKMKHKLSKGMSTNEVESNQPDRNKTKIKSSSGRNEQSRTETNNTTAKAEDPSHHVYDIPTDYEIPTRLHSDVSDDN